MVEKDAVIERQHYKGLAWVASMALFMQSLDATILNTALPTIATDLQTPVFEMQMAIIAYSLAVALFIPFNRLGGSEIWYAYGFPLCCFYLCIRFSRLCDGNVS